MALTEEQAIGYSGDRIWADVGEPVFRSLRRFRALNQADASPTVVYPWLQGKVVMFVGVSSSILGATSVKLAQGTAYTVYADVLFSKTLDSFALNPLARSVYVPSPPDVVQSQFLGWYATGREVAGYLEYCRNQSPTTDSVALEMGQWVGKDVYPSIELFPNLDATLLGHPLLVRRNSPPSKYDVYSIVRKKGGLVVVPFVSSLWRTSFWECQGTWGLLFESGLLGLVMPQYCLDGFRSYPWDASPRELEFLEKGTQQAFLRESWREGKAFSDVDIRAVRDGRTLHVWINSQREFVIVKTPDGYQLRTTARSHPSGALFLKFSQEVVVACELPYDRGFLSITQKLVADHANYQLPKEG